VGESLGTVVAGLPIGGLTPRASSGARSERESTLLHRDSEAITGGRRVRAAHRLDPLASASEDGPNRAGPGGGASAETTLANARLRCCSDQPAASGADLFAVIWDALTQPPDSRSSMMHLSPVAVYRASSVSPEARAAQLALDHQSRSGRIGEGGPGHRPAGQGLKCAEGERHCCRAPWGSGAGLHDARAPR